MAQDQSLVVVVPFFNEEENIDNFFNRLVDGLGHRLKGIVAVDDGSTDQTVTLVQKHINILSVPIRLVRLSRNFGHQSALLAGCEQGCRLAEEVGADWIGTIDGDLQDRPEDFVSLLDVSEDQDVVYAVRAERHDGWVMRVFAPKFYRLLSRTSHFPIPQNAGTFSVIRTPVARQIVDCADADPYFPGLRAWVGYRQKGLLLDRQARGGGTSKVAIPGLIRLSLRALILYSDLPSRVVVGAAGVLFAILAVLAAVVLALRLAGVILPTGVTSILLLEVFSLGLCAAFFSILTLMLGRIKTNSSRQKHWVVMSVEQADAGARNP